MQLLHSVVAVACCWFGVGGGILCVNFMAALSGDACKFRISELKKKWKFSELFKNMKKKSHLTPQRSQSQRTAVCPSASTINIANI